MLLRFIRPSMHKSKTFCKTLILFPLRLLSIPSVLMPLVPKIILYLLLFSFSFLSVHLINVLLIALPWNSRPLLLNYMLPPKFVP